MLRLKATVQYGSSTAARWQAGSRSVARTTSRGPSQRLNKLSPAAAASQSAAVEEAAEEDFYSLLGVSPLADGKEIKAAYYRMVRTCHPDRSGDDDATDFCAMLNEVYETLSDPNKRALYDELAGFSAESVNPFLDDRYPADRVFVDEFSCIGCRNCNNVCPKTFGMEEDYGRARVMVQDADSEAKLQEAIDTCPVSCIHWVTEPQLNLLESAMARMERIAVWSMMGGSGMGANKDVFVEASYAWTRRQSEIRRRVAEAASASSYAPPASQPAAKKSGWAFWNNAVDFGAAAGSQFYNDANQARAKKQQGQEQQQANGNTGNGDRESRAVAGLAARAARAARTWRRYQDVAAASRREKLVLSSTSSASSMDSLSGSISGSMDEADRMVAGVRAGSSGSSGSSTLVR